MDDTDFQQIVQRLGMMIGNRDMVDTFVDVYTETLNQTYTTMSLVSNSDKVARGIYRARGEILKSILERQLNAMDLEWPDMTRKVNDEQGKEAGEVSR